MAKNIEILDRNIRIQVWDTAGQESFRAITRSYYKNSACAVIVYDITKRQSFYNVEQWLKEVKEMCNKEILIVLVGNKIDLEENRKVSTEEAQKFAEENKINFLETSALNGNNIEEIFINSAKELVNKVENGEINTDFNSSGVKIGKFPTKELENSLGKNKKICCY